MSKLPVLIITVMLSSNFVFGASHKECLKGISAVSVLVIGRGVSIAGEDMQSRVELKLRNAGIRTNPKINVPQLAVEIQFFQPKGYYFYAYNIHAFVIDAVSLERSSDISTVAITWFTDNKYGIVGIKFVGELKEEADRVVDEFISDYLSVNPK